MNYLRLSTASQEIPLGPFLSSSDGNTAQTALTIANTDILLHKAGSTSLASKNSGGATHISGGIYYAVLDATDTNTAGSMTIFVHVSGALAVKTECVVLPAQVYDSLIAGSDLLDVNTAQLIGTAPTEGGSGRLAGGVTKFFNVTSPTGTINSMPDAVAGAAGGLFIAGSNAATSANITGNIAGNLTGNVIGNLSGNVTGNLNGNVGGNITGNVTGSVGSVLSKTGYVLASDGLDAIATSAPSGSASNFREMIVQLWRRFFKKVTKTSTQIKTYADNGSTVVTTQTIDDSGNDQTLGSAS